VGKRGLGGTRNLGVVQILKKGKEKERVSTRNEGHRKRAVHAVDTKTERGYWGTQGEKDFAPPRARKAG